jgi:uncharacterized membrane protein
MVDASQFARIALRWFHIVAGVTWIGLLYWFNLVNMPFLKSLDAATRAKVVVSLVPRALWWFRWAAVVTVVFGALLMDTMAMDAGGWAAFAKGGTGPIIMLGGFIGIEMALNVWLIIWPNQKKLIAAARATLASSAPAPPEAAKWARASYLASRTNFVLSLPMLVLMASSSHLGQVRYAILLAGIAAVAALVWVWYLGQPAKTALGASAPPMK